MIVYASNYKMIFELQNSEYSQYFVVGLIGIFVKISLKV